MRREVSARLVVEVTAPADLVFAIAASGHYASTETITATLDGAPVDVSQVEDAHRTRLHRVSSGAGRLTVDYAASLPGAGLTEGATASDLLVYTRPSRYAESDSLAPTAASEFAGIEDPVELVSAVTSWVGTHLSYVSGSSLPTDGAVRTLLARKGVCRDFAHLCVALLRALGIPARLVSVYAPGLSPMDFHAVTEAWIDGRWCVFDATTLAPRATLVRIATGRDAADTAFLTIVSGRAALVELDVTAIADTLPQDDLTRLVALG